MVQEENSRNWHLSTYLFAAFWKAYQVGCCVEWLFRAIIKQLCWPGSICLALQAGCHPSATATRPQFDSDSFAVGVDNHASCCMGNNRWLFENLVLVRTAQKVGGISNGLMIQGKRMLVLTINDDTGKPHRVRIPNSLYLPGLRMCLLSPQHWAQEARDYYPLPNGTRMENNVNNCVLFWGQGKFSKMIPFDAAMNTPIFHTSPSTSSYRSFVNTFQVLEAPFFARERVLQVPGRRWLNGVPPPPEEFVAKENINYHKDTTVSEGDICEDDKTLLTSNLPPPPELAAYPDVTVAMP